MNDFRRLTEVSRPSRYLGGELGSRSKNPDQIELRMALAFPDVYEVGMSHMGFPILYRILNDLDGISAERAYTPWPDMAELLVRDGAPLTSLESGRPLADFDIIGFTLQYELSYTNILWMLQLAGLPVRREERGPDAPLIVVGGPCAFNPEPLADFIDCALIGDGEEAIVELVETVRQARREKLPRAGLLERLSTIPGIYVPSFFEVDYQADGRVAEIRPLKPGYTKVTRRFLADLETAPFPTEPIIPFMQTVHNRVAMEIARGCTRGCRFCQAGYIYRPVRERSPEKIAELVEAALSNSGYEEISLLSLSTGDYSCIEPLLKGLMTRYAEDRVAVSFPSLRVGSLSESLMEEIKKVRKTGFTLAPEAGSERMRQVINKGITEADLLETTHNAFTLGWRVIKLYFMMGLPTETDEDLKAIVELAAQVKRSGRGTQGGADVNVAVSTFVPKPHTPFQWEPQLSIAETLRKQNLLKDGLRSKKLRLKYHEASLSYLEGVFARGDRRLGRLLEAALAAGCRFDGWREHFDYAKWQQAFAVAGIDPDWYLREREESEILPWDHIDCGLSKDFFSTERRKSLELTATPDCRSGECSVCGVCDFEQLRMRLQQPQDLPLPPAKPVTSGNDQLRFRVRLQLSKLGRAKMVAHLEYLTMFQRAVRRAGLPVRFSQGFHPTPKVSYLEALPMGVESEAELVDIELFEPVSAEEVARRLNLQLPEGFLVVAAEIPAAGVPSPSASVAASIYRVPLPGENTDIEQAISTFLASEKVSYVQLKQGVEKIVDLRPDVLGLECVDGELEIRLIKGSPLRVASQLLGLGVEPVRQLGVRKIRIELKS
ncbi:TIGR03960 family B12-binding radical SAM protein [Geopsychrobacter electrodiphilus]|uniref:TIGR03960 family B12-binding radical SAM protein n=1 Tax=Geopsychrobacter electrodiphilus TaxID=225196 RepID=UPI00037CD233|nr:TIGR03960 family B12-binding radical SAM protein [Geopsychrobacter electrodiphilus]